MNYSIVIAKLPKKDGGGYVAHVPDLPGCVSDGATPEEAIANAKIAIKDWIDTAKKLKRSIPQPGSYKQRFQQKQEALKKVLGETIKVFQSLEQRIEQLTGDINEIKETQANIESWTRFNELTKLGTPAPVRRPKKAATIF